MAKRLTGKAERYALHKMKMKLQKEKEIEERKKKKKSKLGKKLQSKVKKIPISPSKFLIGKRMTVRLSGG